MAARVTQTPQMVSVVLRVTNINPLMTEEEFLNEVNRDYGLVLRYIWRRLPDSGPEAFVEINNPERVISQNKQILSRNPSALKFEVMTDIRILNNLIHDLLLVDTNQNRLVDTNQNSEVKIEPRGTVLKATIVDAKLRITIPALHRLFQRYGNVVMIAVVGPKPFDETFSTLQVLVQYSEDWHVLEAYKALNGKEFCQQIRSKITIELTDINDIYVTVRTTQTNTVKHEGQYRNEQRGILAAPAAGPGRGRFIQDRPYNYSNDNSVHMRQGRPPQIQMQTDSSTPVLHLSGIPAERVTQQQFFNLFTLYGNVVKIMFLDPGYNGKRTSLIEMGSNQEAMNAQINLDGIFLCGSRITVKQANRKRIETRLGRFAYVGRPENFRREEQWLNFPPTNRLRVMGLRSNVTIDEMRSFFQIYNPTDVRLHNNNTNDFEVEFGDVATAIEALTALHGTRITAATSRVTITFLQIP